MAVDVVGLDVLGGSMDSLVVGAAVVEVVLGPGMGSLVPSYAVNSTMLPVWTFFDGFFLLWMRS